MHINSSPETTSRIRRTLQYSFSKFFQISSLGGQVLLLSLILAMLWANSRWQHEYHLLWEGTTLGFSFGSFHVEKSLHHWINDGLMTLFFFLVGLEIKREFIAGELSETRKALFPIAAAIGGMIVPACFFSLFNLGSPNLRGWAIPTATDIAFALGILGLLGERASLSFKVFLTALAIVDDIGAVIIIGLFYSALPNWWAIGGAVGILACMAALNRAHYTSTGPYFFLSFLLWLVVAQSGVHATLAGVLAAFAIPVRAGLERQDTARKTIKLAHTLNDIASSQKHILSDHRYLSTLQHLSTVYKDAGVPLLRIEKALHPWVSFGIMPLFALANGGITIEPGMLDAISQPLFLGIVTGLCLGKPLGIVGTCLIMVRLGWAEKPKSISWYNLWGVGFFAGIGFTMSIFIAGMAFGASTGLNEAKLAVVMASTLATIFGFILLQRPEN